MAKKFEDKIKKLEKVADTLSKGESSLDESLSLYKEGLDLVKNCYADLNTLEKEIKVITSENGKLSEKDFV